MALLFSVLLLAAAVVEARSVLRSFRASDQLVASLRRSVEQQGVLLHCRQMQSVRGDGEADGAPGTDGPELAARGAAAGLGAEDVAGVGAALHDTAAISLAALCQNLEASVGQLRRDYAALQATRTSRQTYTYWTLLVTGNLVAVVLVLAVVLALLYVDSEASAMRRIDRARRSVLQIERRQAGFLAAAGHDLRQPLQALRLFLSILLQRRLDPETRAIGGKIDVAAASMQRMIGSLVDVAKLDAGLVAADRRDLPLADLLRSFAEEFSQLARDSGLAFSIEPTDATVHSDPDLLERILRNLLANAIKYTTKGSVCVRVTLAQRTALIAVHDTGIGIQHERQQAVFDDFFRVEPSNSDGLGLGLGIVRRLTDLLEIKLGMESVFGSGSVFSIEVPLSSPQNSQAGVAAASQATERLTALVVDDNELVRDALAAQLEHWGMDVVRAANDRDAWLLATGLQAAPADIVITDYDLGGSTGLDLLQRLEQATGQRPCALIITATSSDHAWEKLRGSDYVCLQKPIDPRRLEEELRRLESCARKRAQPARLSRSRLAPGL